jgi:threonine dehydrogenase-like Zn-dependent dehydrogenase
MCERLCVPARKVHRSAALTLDQLALVETLAIGAHAVARARLEAGETVLVLGAGPIGLATALAALLTGARVFVLERDEHRRNVAVDLGGSLGRGDREPDGVFGPLDPSIPPAVQLSAQCGGALPTCVFDATGSRASMEAAFAYPAASGRLVFVGFQPEPLAFANPEFHRRELTLLASRNSTAVEFAQVIGWLEAGRLDPTPWITHRAGYDTLGETFPSWLQPETGVVKAVLELG